MERTKKKVYIPKSPLKSLAFGGYFDWSATVDIQHVMEDGSFGFVETNSSNFLQKIFD